MELEIYCNGELVNTITDNLSVTSGFMRDLFNYASKNGTVKKMTAKNLSGNGTVSFTYPPKSFGDYMYKYVNVPFNMGYLNSEKILLGGK